MSIMDGASAAHELTVADEPFDMANLSPHTTGLPFVVFISQRGGARHDVRVKVAPDPAPPRFQASLSVRPSVEIVAGQLSPREFDLVRAWIDLNRDVLVAYWEGDIPYTEDAIAALRRLTP
ncbi:MAG: DUF4160 domain-containing protein [Alphaproteobacteria bacterium]|nr:DUF4160 domain-containing protein [Alphaproteobacteria bacterium]